MVENGEPKEPSIKDTIAVSVACVALTGFGVFILALLFQLDLSEVHWSRAAFLLNGVEAVAFAAAGYLFGREVHRGVAASEAKRAEEIKGKGQALANAVYQVAGPPNPQRSIAQTESRQNPLQSLSRLAADLFPSRGLEDRP